MLERVNDWTMAMHNLHQLSVAYIDFAKAFDNVCHSKLIRKLETVSIAEPLQNRQHAQNP